MTEYLCASWREALQISPKEDDTVRVIGEQFPNVTYLLNGHWFSKEVFDLLDCDKSGAKVFSDGDFIAKSSKLALDRGTTITKSTTDYWVRKGHHKMIYPSQAIYKPRAK